MYPEDVSIIKLHNKLGNMVYSNKNYPHKVQLYSIETEFLMCLMRPIPEE